MKPRERVLATLRNEEADRVPYDITHCSNGLGGFNREAARLFQERTGSKDPDRFFGVERDVAWVDLRETRLDLAERYLPFHRLPDDLTCTIACRTCCPDLKETLRMHNLTTAATIGANPWFTSWSDPSATAYLAGSPFLKNDLFLLSPISLFQGQP